MLVPGSESAQPTATERRRPLVTALVAAVVVLVGAGVVAGLRFTAQDSTAPPSPGPTATSASQPLVPSTYVQAVTSTAVKTADHASHYSDVSSVDTQRRVIQPNGW